MVASERTRDIRRIGACRGQGTRLDERDFVQLYESKPSPPVGREPGLATFEENRKEVGSMTFEGQRPQVCDEKKERTTLGWFPLIPESESDLGYVAPLIDVAELEESIRVAAEAIDRLTKKETG